MYDTSLTLGGSKLGTVKFSGYVDQTQTTTQTFAGAASLSTGDGVKQASTTLDLSWSDVTLYATKILLGWKAVTTIAPLSLTLKTAANLNYDHGAFTVGASVKDATDAEMLKLGAHGRYEDTSALWFVQIIAALEFCALKLLISRLFLWSLHRLFAADEISVYMGGNKLVTVTSTIDFTDVLPGALKYHLLAADGSGNTIAATDSSVTWTKPLHTTWDEAGKFRVKSVFHPLFTNPNSKRSFFLSHSKISYSKVITILCLQIQEGYL